MHPSSSIHRIPADPSPSKIHVARLFKNTSYNNIVRYYPNHISSLHQLVTKEHDLLQHASLFSSSDGPCTSLAAQEADHDVPHAHTR